jgi:hypothetical protein
LIGKNFVDPSDAGCNRTQERKKYVVKKEEKRIDKEMEK